MSSFDDFLKEQLNDPEFKAEYDALEPEFASIQAMIDTRKAFDLTKKELSSPDIMQTVVQTWCICFERATALLQSCGSNFVELTITIKTQDLTLYYN